MNDAEDNASLQAAADQSRATDESLVRVHARVRKIPVPGSPTLFFSMMALVVVVVFAWFYFRRYMAEFDSSQYLYTREAIQAFASYEPASGEAEEVDLIALGEQLYSQQCVACHQADGQGVAGAFPPLDGSNWVVGDDGGVPIRILLAGLSGPVEVKGETYNGVMPGFGGAWDDEQIAAAVSYIRQAWGNEEGEVSPERVAEIRAEIGSRSPYSAGELQGFLE